MFGSEHWVQYNVSVENGFYILSGTGIKQLEDEGLMK